MRTIVLFLITFLGFGCSTVQHSNISRVPSSALLIGRNGGVVLIHKSGENDYVVKQCQDFIEVKEKKDCRLVSGTEEKHFTKDQIIAEIGRILQLPRFKPEIPDSVKQAKRAEQMKLFRCADKLSMLKYEIYRRQKFGETYGFFKEDLKALQSLVEQSTKISCSKAGIERIQRQINLANKTIIDDLLLLIESEEMNIISSPKISKGIIPLENELAGVLTHVEVEEATDVSSNWEIIKDDKGAPFETHSLLEAVLACKERNMSLLTMAEIAQYASQHGASYRDYDQVKELGFLRDEGSRFSTLELDSSAIMQTSSENLDLGDFYSRYYKFSYWPGTYPRKGANFFGNIKLVWTSSKVAEFSDRVLSFGPPTGVFGAIELGNNDLKQAVVCTNSFDKISFGP